MNYKQSFLLILLSNLKSALARNKACELLMIVDDSVEELFNKDQDLIEEKVILFVDKLNTIYQSTILADPPNDNIYFQIKELRILHNFLPGCTNKQVLLDEVSKLGTGEFCLVHLLTARPTGCVLGLANLGGLCKRFSNTGWTKVDAADDGMTVHTMAHEIGHNFGSKHDGGNSSTYRGCGTPEKQGIMGGKRTGNFSTCSLSAMHARLQTVLKEEKETPCFVHREEAEQFKFITQTVDYPDKIVECPPDTEDDCDEDQPDPPDIPDPPEPVCGDQVVDEPYEECDCGQDYKECQDPCCYPAKISKEQLLSNSSAKPCTRNQTPLCLNPNYSQIKFGLIFPFSFILLLIIVLAILLWLDWRYGKRVLYSHIVKREKSALHVENEEQRERRIQRQKLKSENGF